ncbi:MAG TPA: hypothetical protein PLZ08_10105 [Bacillota bacterium]|jgi:hypothetical protein|nr:hypothetical protein [Bacillota bacterium]HOL10588.1 hypothetical protein [Bacillota bacterium]HPO98290.1 hypothetical protein [Bacillota bacterium]
MAFTFAQTNSNNHVETYNLEISINPAAAIINQVLGVGDTIHGSINVVNTGNAHADVYLTADWGPASGTTDLEATLLANALEATVVVSANPPDQKYHGSLIGLINQQVINDCAPTSNTIIQISLVIPDNRSGPTLLSKSIHTNFVFVAIAN